jgi:hypothetical protein
LILLVATSLVACKSREQFAKKMDGWVRSSADRLVMAWGPPQRAYQLSDGGKILEWTDTTEVTVPGITTYNTQYVGNTAIMTQETRPDTVHKFRCTMRFQVDSSGIIRSWRSEGSECAD